MSNRGSSNLLRAGKWMSFLWAFSVIRFFSLKVSRRRIARVFLYRRSRGMSGMSIARGGATESHSHLASL